MDGFQWSVKAPESKAMYVCMYVCVCVCVRARAVLCWIYIVYQISERALDSERMKNVCSMGKPVYDLFYDLYDYIISAFT